MNRAMLIVLALILRAGDARAQPGAWTDRGYVSVSGWYQAAAATFGAVVHPVDFVEPSLVDTSYTIQSEIGVDAGGGVRVWRNLSVGASVSRFSKSGQGSVSAQVPHPFFFNRPRPVSGGVSGLTRDEAAVHVQARWVVPFSGRWQLGIAGGPSWFSVGQDLVSDVTVTETYPFDTATFDRVTSQHRSGSGAGFNGGADLDYMVRPRVGIGIGVTFSRARLVLDDATTVTAGGAHVSGGLRFLF
jgi:hypothetical protein